MTNEGRTINILWTGGLDSTFRVVELSQRKCTIQPYYFVTKRKSLRHELNAIRKITRILRKDKRTQATLRNPIIVGIEDRQRDATTFDSWYRLMKGRSWQYYEFAKYAAQYNIEMEMGLQFSPNGSVAKNIDKTLLIPHPDADYDVQIIDKTRADQDTINVFGRFYFPKSLYHKTKGEEVEILRTNGYEKVLKHIWFCFDPMWGYPCGHCFPCRSSEKEGVPLPHIGKILYTIHHFFRKKKKARVLKLNYDFVFYKVSDVYVVDVTDPQTGEVIKHLRMNDTSIFILKALQTGADLDEVAKRMTEAYDVDYETAKQGASDLIAKLNL